MPPFRRFVGLNPNCAVCVPALFSKHRDRLVDDQIAEAFLQTVLHPADRRGLLSQAHLCVDGTLFEAWLSHRSTRPKDDPSSSPSSGGTTNPGVNLCGETRTSTTHHSVTNPDARLTRKRSGASVNLAPLGSVLMDSLHGLRVATSIRAPSRRRTRRRGLDAAGPHATCASVHDGRR
jgi:hypothetical protein